MYQTSEGVQRAAREVLTELSIPAGKILPDGVSGAYTLLFRHECRYLQGIVMEHVTYAALQDEPFRSSESCLVTTHNSWQLTVALFISL